MEYSCRPLISRVDNVVEACERNLLNNVAGTQLGECFLQGDFDREIDREAVDAAADGGEGKR